MRRLSLAIAACSVVLAASPSRVRAAEAPPIEPWSCRVVLLPVLERSGRKGEERDLFVRTGGDVLRAEFQKAGFAFADGYPDAAARELKIDLLDDDQRGKASYARIAQRLGARLVVAAVIRGVVSGVKTNVFTVQKAGKAGVQIAVYDAAAERFVINGNYTGQKEWSVLFPGFDKSRTKRTGALAAAFHNGFLEFAREAGIASQVGKPGKTR